MLPPPPPKPKHHTAAPHCTTLHTTLHHHSIKLTQLLEDLVALVDDKVAHRREVERALVGELLDAPRGADDDRGRVALELGALLLDVEAAEVVADLDVGHELGEARELVADLVRELARVAEHDGEHLGLVVGDLDLLQDRDHKHRRLAHARLGLAEHVVAHDRLRDALVLDCRFWGVVVLWWWRRGGVVLVPRFVSMHGGDDEGEASTVAAAMADSACMHRSVCGANEAG